MKKAIKFILSNQEPNGFWRYYGKKSFISPDLDDTVCALTALYNNKCKIDTDFYKKIILTKNEN